MTFRNGWREEGVAIALLVVVVLLPFADVVAGRRVFFRRDTAQYHFPMKKAVRDLVRSGEFPSWDRLRNEGQPLAENPAYEVFYPLQWLTLAGSYLYTFNLHILLHLPLAAAGMYLFLRSRRLTRSAAWLGAVSFALGGPMLSFLGILPSLFGWAWAPWIVMFAIRFAEQRRALDLVLGAAAMAMQWLVGEPATILQTAAIALVLALAGVPQRRLSSVLRAAAVVAAGAAVAAVQLLPALDYARRSIRAHPFAFWHVSLWSFHPLRLIELAFPHFAGDVSFGGERFYGAARLYDGSLPFVLSVYTGVLIIILALAGFGARIDGWKPAALIAVVSLAVAIGSYTPLLRVLYEVRIFSSMRFPEKMIAAAAFALTMFAAMTFDAIIRGDAGAARGARVSAVLLAAAAVFAAALTFAPHFQQTFAARWHVAVTEAGRLSGAARAGWLIAAARGLAAAALLWWVANRPSRRAVAAVCLFATIDLAVRTIEIAPRTSPLLYARPSLVDKLPAASGGRIVNEVANADAKRSERALPLQLANLYPLYPEAWDRATAMQFDYDETELFVTNVYRSAAERARKSADRNWPELYLAMSNVQARIVPSGTSECAVVTSASDNARYYFADSFASTAALVNPSGRIFSPRTAFVRGAAFRPASGIVRAVSERTASADLEVDAKGPALLIASVTWDRNWTAFVDGRPSAVAQVNLSHQGIVVPPGRHHIALRYRNRLLPVGAAISLVSVVAMILALIREMVTRSRGHEVTRPAPRDLVT